MNCNLPPELYEDIILYAAQEKEDIQPSFFQVTPQSKKTTLSTLILVNKVFAHIARRHLFASVFLSNSDKQTSLERLREILSLHSFTPAYRWVRSLTVDFHKPDPQGTGASKIAAMVDILSIIHRHSPSLESFGFDGHSQITNIDPPSNVADLLSSILRICQFCPTLRRLTISGLRCLPIGAICNPNLESLTISWVKFGRVFDGLIGDNPREPGVSTLKSLAFVKTYSSWNEEDTPSSNPSDFVTLVETMVSYGYLPRATFPLFPQLTSMTCMFRKHHQRFGSETETRFIERHVPNLEYLTLHYRYPASLYTATAVPNLREMHRLRTLEIRYTAHFPALAGIRFIQNTIKSVAQGLTALILRFDLVRGWSGGIAGQPLSPEIRDAWLDLSHEIARCPAEHVQIYWHMDVIGQTATAPVNIQPMESQGPGSEVLDLFMHLHSAKEAFCMYRSYYGNSTQR